MREQLARVARRLAGAATRATPEFLETARRVSAAHGAQTRQDVAALQAKYVAPVLGRVDTWSLFERLAECVDPTDVSLGCASQQLHVLQVLEAMERDGVDDPVLIAAALVHDLGKVLLLTGEAPENVVCFNTPIGPQAAGSGLANCVLQWNHDEFAWTRLREHLSEPVAWLVRFHSIRVEACEALMDSRDRAFLETWLRPFQRYDQGSKSAFRLPRRSIASYREQVAALLPASLEF